MAADFSIHLRPGTVQCLARGHETMKSTKFQLLLALAAVLAVAGLYVDRGLPPNRALFDAVYDGDCEQTRRSLRWGTDIEMKDNADRTPLEWAVGVGDHDLVQLLLHHGADTDLQIYPYGGLASDDGTQGESPRRPGRTLLHIAAMHGWADTAEFLLDRGARVDVKDPSDQTPLELAVGGAHKDVAVLLVAHGADVNARGSSGESLLKDIIGLDGPEAVKLLIALGADIDAKDVSGQTALHWTALFGGAEKAALLIAAGADVNARDDGEWTPLHVAADHGELALAELLLDHGAEVGARTSVGQTPLHLAAALGRTRVVELLIRRGADVHARDAYGKTPMATALAPRPYGMPEYGRAMADLLRQHGAKE